MLGDTGAGWQRFPRLLVFFFLWIATVTADEPCVYKDYLLIKDQSLNPAVFQPPMNNFNGNRTFLLNPCSPYLRDYLYICPGAHNDTIALIYEQNPTSGNTVCLYHWSKDERNVSFRTKTSVLSAYSNYQFILKISERLNGLQTTEQYDLYKFVFSKYPANDNKTDGTYSNVFTRKSDAKRYYQAYNRSDLKAGQTIYDKPLAPWAYACLRYAIFLGMFVVFIYSAILNTSRHTIFGGKLYPFNAYMIVACVHETTSILEVLIFSLFPKIDLELWQSFTFQFLATVACLVWMARSSRLLVYRRVVPVYQVIAFINWSVGAFLVSVYFLPVSWLLYGLMYFGNKFSETTNQAYEWRLSLSVAIDFIGKHKSDNMQSLFDSLWIGTILPFLVMKEGAMFYLLSRNMAFMYRSNLFFGVYFLMVLSVVPIAIVRSKIVQHHFKKKDNFAQGTIASVATMPAEVQGDQNIRENQSADHEVPLIPSVGKE